MKKNIKCCHDLNKKECTIKIMKRKFMVCPDTKVGVCTCCGKSFTYNNTENIESVVNQNNETTPLREE